MLPMLPWAFRKGTIHQWARLGVCDRGSCAVTMFRGLSRQGSDISVARLSRVIGVKGAADGVQHTLGYLYFASNHCA